MKTEHEKKFINKILDELAKAESKHPKFCDAITNKSKDAVRKALAELRIENSKGPYYADRILHEEIAEYLEAYQMNALVSCMEELAQCGAVILRIMEFVQKEIEAKTLGTGVKPNVCARSAGAMGRL